MAEKSFVNDAAEMLGAALLVVEVAALAVELDELELEDELPHPATTATVSSAVVTALIRLKDIKHSLSGWRHRRQPHISWVLPKSGPRLFQK
jgi:hypothetical protein